MQENYWESACEVLIKGDAYHTLQNRTIKFFKRWIKASTYQVLYRVDKPFPGNLLETATSFFGVTVNLMFWIPGCSC